MIHEISYIESINQKYIYCRIQTARHCRLLGKHKDPSQCDIVMQLTGGDGKYGICFTQETAFSPLCVHKQL